MTWKDGVIVPGKKKTHKGLLQCPYSFVNENHFQWKWQTKKMRKRVSKAKVITWHDFNTSCPYELHPSDDTVSSLLDILRDLRKIMGDARPVSTRVSKLQKENS